MTPYDKPRSPHVKPREKTGEPAPIKAPLPPKKERVRPMAGEEARSLRAEDARQQKRLAIQKPSSDAAPPKPRLFSLLDTDEAPVLKPIKPPAWVGRRLKRRSAPSAPAPSPRLTDRVRPKGLVWLSWRWVSGTLTLVLGLLLLLLLFSPSFYVRSVAVGGVNYLTREDVFGTAGVSGQHIFWLDPDAIERRLEAHRNIASAEVRVGFPPRMVQILIREREPILTWEQGDERVWVDINGVIMFQRQDRPDLLRIVYDRESPLPPVPISAQPALEVGLVHGALLLKAQLPTIDVMLYHPDKGLGWRDPQGWMVWFGVGDNMAMRALVYAELVAQTAPLLQFGEVDLSDPDNPVYTVLWRKDGGGGR